MTAADNIDHIARSNGIVRAVERCIQVCAIASGRTRVCSWRVLVSALRACLRAGNRSHSNSPATAVPAHLGRFAAWGPAASAVARPPWGGGGGEASCGWCAGAQKLQSQTKPC